MKPKIEFLLFSTLLKMISRISNSLSTHNGYSIQRITRIQSHLRERIEHKKAYTNGSKNNMAKESTIQRTMRRNKKARKRSKLETKI